jgi:hypothetical protein
MNFVPELDPKQYVNLQLSNSSNPASLGRQKKYAADTPP